MLLIKNGYIKTMAGADLKNGCVVIWTADPLITIGAEAYITIVDGRVVYSAE